MSDGHIILESASIIEFVKDLELYRVVIRKYRYTVNQYDREHKRLKGGCTLEIPDLMF